MGDTPDLSLRIQTDPLLDSGPPCLRVAWVDWDSGLAASGLQIGDRITAINGQPLVKPAPEAVPRWLCALPGQTAEVAAWRQAGAVPGQPVSLRVKRRATDGWQTMEVSGELREDRRVYNNSAGRRSLSPQGPEEMGCDGFPSSWRSWYDSEVSGAMAKLLKDGWQSSWFSNRYELQNHLARKERVDFLLRTYPGPFADAVHALWEQTRQYLEGPRYDLSAEDLRWRQAEDEKLQHARDRATRAWADFQAAVAAETIPAFPAVHPVRGDRQRVTGKYVVLPPVGNRNWLSFAGQTYFAFGSPGDGFYFADAESEAAQAMLMARERFERLVTPYLGATYAFVGRIADNAHLKVVEGSGYFGLEVEIAAALIGDAMFVDLRQRRGVLAPFAGEEDLTVPAQALPPDDAAPRQVMEAFIGTLKSGDLKLWRQLFADWSITTASGGRLKINPHDLRINDNYWQYSRQTMVKKVADLRVGWVDDPQTLATGQEFAGAPKLEQVDVQLEAIGLFDGEYRKFGAGINRAWQLQRLNGGPWRISSLQNL